MNDDSAPRSGVHCLVSGRVQGVGFGMGEWQEAERLGLTGWVRNLATGEVEAEAYGDTATLQRFCAWLEQGPRTARVSEVRVTDIAWQELRGFRLR